MTTLEPGASVVFTQGLRASPASTAFLASSAAPTITDGLEVLVQEVMAAITTEPWSTEVFVPSSSVSSSEYRACTAGSCHRPCSLAYASTSATCSGERPVSRRYASVSPSIGKIAHVDPNSGLMLPIVARLATGTAATPSP